MPVVSNKMGERSQMREIRLKVNDEWATGLVKPNTTLLRFLRDSGFTEVKKGCGEGDCGTCTVLLDGKAVNSCLILAPQVDGREVMTIEGLGTPERLHPLQQKFVDHLSLQCGFCGPGMLLSAKALLDENPDPSEEEVRTAITGNLCRCTGYTKVTQAILDAAKKV